MVKDQIETLSNNYNNIDDVVNDNKENLEKLDDKIEDIEDKTVQNTDKLEDTSIILEKLDNHKNNLGLDLSESKDSEIESSQTNLSEQDEDMDIIKKHLKEKVKSTIDELFENITHSEMIQVKKVFIDRVATKMNSELDAILEDIRGLDETPKTKEAMKHLIVKYNTNLLDFLEHKLTLE